MRLTDQEKINICQEYQAGSSSVQIGKKYGVTHVSILGILKRRNIATRPANPKKNEN